jgi:transcriptional regulator with XRE-family HTH domain
MTTKPPRKARSELAPWQREDAERLARLFKANTRLSQAAFGAQFGIGTQSMVWQYMSGYRPLSAEVAARFARGLDVDLREISPRLAEEVDAMAAATRSSNAVPALATAFGVPISQAGVLVGAEWEKLVEPMRSAIATLIDVLVAQQKISEKKAQREQRFALVDSPASEDAECLP